MTATLVPEVFDNASDERLKDAFGNRIVLSSIDRLPGCLTYLTCSCRFSYVKLREAFGLFLR